VAGQSAVGDASTTSLVVPGAAAAIAADVPAARIVAVLRHPVDRAFSHHSHFVAAGGDDIADFARAVQAEKARQAAGYPFTYQYTGWSRYTGQLRPFFDLFGRDQVLVHLYDDVCADAEAVVRSTFRFLDVADEGAVEVGRFNAVETLGPRPKGRRRLLRRPVPDPARPRPILDPALRAELTDSFADEIDQLEQLLQRDLSAWRND
jgi:hypothetical protein